MTDAATAVTLSGPVLKSLDASKDGLSKNAAAIIRERDAALIEATQHVASLMVDLEAKSHDNLLNQNTALHAQIGDLNIALNQMTKAHDSALAHTLAIASSATDGTPPPEPVLPTMTEAIAYYVMTERNACMSIALGGYMPKLTVSEFARLPKNELVDAQAARSAQTMAMRPLPVPIAASKT